MSRLRYPQGWLIPMVLSLVVWGLIAVGVEPAIAQDGFSSLGRASFGIVSDIVYAPVRLDGRDLFSIAANLNQVEGDRNGIGLLQVRRRRVENNLKSQLQTLLIQGGDPASLQVVPVVLNQQMAVQAVVDGNPGRSLVTITSLDAEIYGVTEAELADEFARRIQAGLVRGIAERQPEAQRAQARQALGGTAITAIGVALMYGLERRLVRSRRRLKQDYLTQQTTLSQPSARPKPEDLAPSPPPDHHQELFQIKRQIEHVTWQKRLLQLALVGTGLIGLAWVLQRFPQSRPVGVLLVKQPLGVLLLGMVVSLVIVASRLLIDRALTRWSGTEFTLPANQLARRRQRAITYSKIYKDLVTILGVILGVLIAINLLALSSGWTLTLQLGVVGVVISLAFQSAIKNAVAGAQLLARDAYTLGDIIAVDGVSGVVEAMDLSLTQIRSSAGQLITLHNGDIATVINSSRDWSRMDYTLWVDHDTDIPTALALMQDVLHSLQTDPHWATHRIENPDILAVDQVTPQGILLKIRAQTAPGQQFGLTREYHLRLLHAFKTHNIQVAIPQQELRYRSSNPLVSNN
ncbi:MAG: mechanosensitive ion channel family protein [Nodosilinea sp.]